MKKFLIILGLAFVATGASAQLLTINQYGTLQFAYVSQQGEYSYATIKQSGDYNLVRLTQKGGTSCTNCTIATIEQVGSKNLLLLDQNSGSVANITQKGTNNITAGSTGTFPCDLCFENPAWSANACDLTVVGPYTPIKLNGTLNVWQEGNNNHFVVYGSVLEGTVTAWQYNGSDNKIWLKKSGTGSLSMIQYGNDNRMLVDYNSNSACPSAIAQWGNSNRVIYTATR